MPRLEVIMWTWRDGSVHPEMRLATFLDEVTGEAVTHLQGDERFHSACGLPFFGRLSSTGLGNPARVDCEACREFLVGRTFIDSGAPDHATRVIPRYDESTLRTVDTDLREDR